MKKVSLVLLYCAVVLTACQSETETQTQANATKPSAPVEQTIPLGQLGDAAEPTHYRLELTLDPDAERLQGVVTIALDLLRPARQLYLHGQGLTVASVSLEAAGTAYPAQYEQVDEGGVARVSWEPELAGSMSLRLEYSAPYSESLDSIYKVREGGETYLFSQMESISARMSIPSFDEPRFKTPFDIIITAQADDVVITNTPEVEAQPLGNGMVRRTFLTTKPLPTYLLAFAVGKLDVVEYEDLPPTALRDRPIPLRGVAVQGKGEQLEFALEHTQPILEALEEYFGTAYPYEKLDIIAAPDFAFGAMENAGAIVYRESLLLLDENSPLRQKMAYGSVHAHELGHQWFGNLVTPKWWDDIWLNESFATWIADKAAHQWRPEYEFDRAMVRTALGAMAVDALSSARQIRQPIESNDDIMNAFDGITYSKGGSVLQMFESFVGPEAFREGVRLHMQRFPFLAADINDFVKSLADGSGNVDIIPAFESYLYQSGVPSLEIEVDCSQGAQLRLSQQRYVPLGIQRGAPQQWAVPFCYKTDRGEHCQLIEQVSQTVELDQCPAYVMPNRDGKGYYRWNFSGAQWDALMANLDQLNANEQVNLIDNLRAAFRARQTSVATLLSAYLQVAQSDSWDVISAPSGDLPGLRFILLQGDYSPDYKAYIASLYAPHLQRLGLEPTTAADRADATGTARLRGAVVSVMAREARDPQLRQQLTARAKAYLGDGKSLNKEAITSDLVGLALEVAVEESDRDFAERLKVQGLASTDAIFRGDVLSALSNTQDVAFGRSLIDELLLSDQVRSNEAQALIGQFMRNPLFRDYGWSWVQANLDEFLKRYSSFSVARVIDLGGNFCDAQSRDQMQRFFSGVQDRISGAPRKIAENVERVNQCIALRDAYQQSFAEQLKQASL